MSTLHCVAQRGRRRRSDPSEPQRAPREGGNHHHNDSENQLGVELELEIFELERRSVVEKKTTSPTEQVNRRGNATKRRNFFFFHSDSFCFPPHFVVVFVRLTITTPSRPKVFFGSRWRWRETATGFLTRVQTLLLSFFCLGDNHDQIFLVFPPANRLYNVPTSGATSV